MLRFVRRSGRPIDHVVAPGSTRSDVQCGLRRSQSVSLAQYLQSRIFTHGAVLIAATAPLHAEYDQIGKIDPTAVYASNLSVFARTCRPPSELAVPLEWTTGPIIQTYVKPYQHSI